MVGEIQRSYTKQIRRQACLAKSVSLTCIKKGNSKAFMMIPLINRINESPTFQYSANIDSFFSICFSGAHSFVCAQQLQCPIIILSFLSAAKVANDSCNKVAKSNTRIPKI